MDTIIENRTIDTGIAISDCDGLTIRNCVISNRGGLDGIALRNCSRVRIEHCRISRIGNETMQETGVRTIHGYDFVPAALDRIHGIHLHDCSDAVIAGNEITDSCSKGISITASDAEKSKRIVIENNRIAYIYDDGIDFGITGADRDVYLPIAGVIIRGNIIHDIGLGLTRLGFARHGIYLTVRDALVENNTIYNCFYGEGVSIRNAAVVRGNDIRNCARACIGFWRQTNTEESSRAVRIEGNRCRQDFALPIPMRHIANPHEKLHHLPLGVIVIQHWSNPRAVIDRIELRRNALFVGPDYHDDIPMIAGNDDASKNASALCIEDNSLIDMRTQPRWIENMPDGIDTGTNTMKPDKER
ncbi:MAG: right-handed parallel beta-helix repeat-containing protein [Spirochaetes bacterium]|nr:right-handed parallel beta-helix repeat-containing protein [Spirochaetota bacterium]